MSVLHRLRPDSLLTRVRLACLVFACSGVLVPMFQTDPSIGTHWRVLGVTALIMLFALHLSTYLRQRTFLLEPVVLAILVIIGGSSLTDSDTSIGLLIGGLVIGAMHSSTRQVMVRVVLLVVAYGVTMATSRSAATDPSVNMSQHVSIVVMLVVFGLLTNRINMAMQGQQRAARRESLLARTGLDLIELTDATAIQAIAAQHFLDLCAEWPEHAVVVARRTDVGSVVVVATMADLAGTVLPAIRLEAAAGTLSPLDESARQALARVAGGDRWSMLAFGGDDEGLILLVSGKRIPSAMGDALRSVIALWALAESNCRNHAELGRRAHSDQLTALHNRRSFLQRLGAVRAQTGRSDRHSALLMIDLDDFKQINDVYGHAAGDQVLVEIADRITAVGGGAGWAARLGGDEFALLLNELPSTDAARQAAETLRESILRPVQLPQATVDVGASIGIAFAAADLSAGDFMRCADIAMYSAKAKGKNRVETFSDARHGSVAQVRRIEEHLGTVIARDEIGVHYQPQIDLRTGRCVGLEALARWHDDAIGEVPATTFIPLAIRAGHIAAIGAHVLRTACGQLAAWRGQPSFEQLSMSVNVAAPQLYDPGFADLVQLTLQRSGVPADRLILDLTGEPAIDIARAAASLTAVTALGVRVALDAGGPDGVSFEAIRAIPVHRLRFRESPVAEVRHTHEAIVQIVVAAATILGIDTVAERVESPVQADRLRASGVDIAQGHLFARPMPADEVTTWLTSQHGLTPAALGASR